MDAKVIWQQGLTFTGTADSGFDVPLGSEPEVGGADDGFRPIELMAVSLAGCTAMDVVSIMLKKQQKMTAFEVKVHVDRAQEHPKVFTHLHVTYQVTGHGLDEQALLRSIGLSITKYCPAYAMLSRLAPIESDYEIFEGASPSDRQLVKTGTYTL